MRAVEVRVLSWAPSILFRAELVLFWNVSRTGLKVRAMLFSCPEPRAEGSIWSSADFVEMFKERSILAQDMHQSVQ